MEKSREDGSGGTKTGIHIPPPPMTAPSKLFFTTQWPVFSCVSHELCKRLWNPFLPLARARQEKGGRKDRSERKMPPPHFFLFRMLLLNNLSCWQCGPGFRLCGHVKG